MATNISDAEKVDFLVQRISTAVSYEDDCVIDISDFSNFNEE